MRHNVSVVCDSVPFLVEQNLQLLLDAKARLQRGESVMTYGTGDSNGGVVAVMAESFPTAYAEPVSSYEDEKYDRAESKGYEY